MTQDKAHPTPPAVPSERETFEAWYGARRGTGLLGKIATGRYEWDTTQDAWVAFQAGRATHPALAAPVASNTTAEPAPIQPAGVEVERDVKRAREILARLCDRGLVSMSIPVRDDDEDMVLSRIIDLAASQGDRGKT